MSEIGIAQKKNSLFTITDHICAVLLALCPLLQHYIAPLYNMAITVMIVIAAYLILRILLDVHNVKWGAIAFVAVMVAYQIFRVVNHGTTVAEFGQSGVFIVFILAVALGKINLDTMLKACRAVCLLASGYLILQYVFYYLFKIHLQMAPTDLLIKSADQWVLVAQTGLAGVTGRVGNLYRPSAFFLEPSHMYIYAFPHLILLLFKEKITKKVLLMAGLISLGLILTTSGMGIAAAAGIWGLFLVFRDERDGTFSFKNILRKRNLIAMGLLAVGFIGATVCVPFVRSAVLRVFIPGATGSTAITGRVSGAWSYIEPMTFWQWIWGVADNTNGITTNFPGLLDALYRHGLIGVVLSYELYVKCMVKLPLAYKLIGAVILITSLFSGHTHSLVGMLYFLLVLMSGFACVDQDKSPIQSYTIPCRDTVLSRIFKKKESADNA